MRFEYIPGITAAGNDPYVSSNGNPLHANVFDLEDLISENAYFYYIDDMLFVQNKFDSGSIFNLSQFEIEQYILKFYREFVRVHCSVSTVKECARLLSHRDWPHYTSASTNNILCLNNGYIDLNHLPSLQCQPYIPGNPYPYSTFGVNFDWPSFVDQANQVQLYGDFSGWYDRSRIPCPTMDRFISQIASGNQKIFIRIWEMIGYLLTPTNRKYLFLLQGVPDSGKSILANLIRAYYPTDQIENMDIDQLGKRTATSQLIHKSINMSMDLPNKTLPTLAIRSIKMITGQDDITVQFSNDNYRSCKINCRFMFASNHPLTLKGRDDAFENRIICIPFKVSIPREQQDPFLLQRLILEKDAIFLKALYHYQQLSLHNFVFTGSGDSLFDPDIYYVPNDEEESMGHILEFVDEKCEFIDINQGGTFSEDLFYAYQIFCKEKNYTPINTIGSFTSKFKKACGTQVSNTRWRDEDLNQRGFRGVKLKNEAIHMHLHSKN